MVRFALVLALLVVSCGPGSKGGPAMNNRMNAPAPVAQGSDVASGDILAREPVANTAQVKHILIGWKDLDSATDDRAKKRTKAEAEALVRSLLTQLKAGADFDMLAKQHSEDPGSVSGHAYPVSPDASLVIEFKQLALRLNVGELGVVQSDYGFHIMKRVE